MNQKTWLGHRLKFLIKDILSLILSLNKSRKIEHSKAANFQSMQNCIFLKILRWEYSVEVNLSATNSFVSMDSTLFSQTQLTYNRIHCEPFSMKILHNSRDHSINDFHYKYENCSAMRFTFVECQSSNLLTGNQ